MSPHVLDMAHTRRPMTLRKYFTHPERERKKCNMKCNRIGLRVLTERNERSGYTKNSQQSPLPRGIQIGISLLRNGTSERERYRCDRTICRFPFQPIVDTIDRARNSKHMRMQIPFSINANIARLSGLSPPPFTKASHHTTRRVSTIIC